MEKIGEVTFKRRIAHDRPIGMLPRQRLCRSDRHCWGQIGGGWRAQTKDCFAGLHEPVHSRLRLLRHWDRVNTLDWQRRRRARCEVRFRHPREYIAGLAVREEVDGVKGTGDVKAIRPLENVSPARMLVSPRGDIVPLATDFDTNCAAAIHAALFCLQC